ncbi:MAG: hypothetical protein HUM72_12505 [Dolichospermum sp.]|nr:hypothetical protein [Dolichospermum sp.]
MPDLISGSTELGTTKAALIASMVQKELTFKAKLTPFFTDLSVLANPGSISIAMPKLSSFTVIDRVEGVYGDSSQLTSTNDVLTMDQNLYVSWIIDSTTALQSNINAELEFARRAAAAQARAVDNLILAEIRAVCSSFLNVGTDVDVTYANVLAMVRYLEERDAAMEDTVWLVSPQQKAAIFALAEFKNQYQFGAATLPSGVIGTILGSPVVMHSGLTGKEMFLADKAGIAYAFQRNAAYAEQKEIGYGVFAKKAAIDQVCGFKGMQLAQRGAASGKSPLVIGLND